MRRRIPTDLLDTYRAGRREIVVSLGTSDLERAHVLLRGKLVALDNEFAARRTRLEEKLRDVVDLPPRQKLCKLYPELLDSLANSWHGAMLRCDEQRRLEGFADAAFEELGNQLVQGETLIAVPTPALCELVRVLLRGYRYTPAQVAQPVRTLIQVRQVVCHTPAVLAGLALLEAGGDFADRAMAYEDELRGGPEFVTFDQQAAGLLKAHKRKANWLRWPALLGLAGVTTPAAPAAALPANLPGPGSVSTRKALMSNGNRALSFADPSPDAAGSGRALSQVPAGIGPPAR